MPIEFGESQSTRVPVQRPASAVATLPHAPRSSFLLRHNPLRWQCIDGEWLPLPCPMVGDPGVGAVDKDGDDTIARVEGEKQGWQVIPWDAVPPGTPGGEYIAAHRASGGLYHCTIWETPRSLGGRVLPPDLDQEGYHEWLRWLVAEGVVAPPDPAVVQSLVGRQERKVASLARESHKPEMRAAIQREKAKLEEMRAATAKLRPSKPTRSKKPPKSAGEKEGAE